MTARVGIAVQDDEAMLASMNEQTLLVCCTFGCRAEDTLVRFVLCFHVSGSPWRPQMGHMGQEGLRNRGSLLQLQAQGPHRCSEIRWQRPLSQIGLPYPVIPCSA